MIKDAARVLNAERSRLRAAEDQFRRLEARASAAEARARESENMVARVEEAIRTQLLRQSDSEITTAAA
jgi:hypothetical protein